MNALIKKITPRFVVKFYRIFRAWSANVYFGFPSRKLIVVGVTGTDGKTTTCHLIRELLVAAGHQTGLLSTIVTVIGGESRVNETKMTTINAWQIQKSLAAMVKKNDRYAVVETSSHALDQDRAWGIAYDVAVITNTSHEHLDYHGTMDEYRAAKAKLFSGLAKSYRKSFVGKAAVLNQEDDTFDSYRQYQADQQIFYGLNNGHIYARDPQYTIDGTKFTVLTPVGELKISTRLVGEHNVMNCLAAISVAFILGVQPRFIISGLNQAKAVPGRFERINEGQNFNVIIDYAVTPRAFNSLYSMIHRFFLKPNQRVIAVFGAAGERDRAKRPILGEIAAKYCQQVYLTNEDPYGENQEFIVSEVARGLIGKGRVQGRDFWIEMDRSKAITKAIKAAQPGDFVIITGKGAETSMAVGRQRIPWDDREKAREAIRGR